MTFDILRSPLNLLHESLPGISPTETLRSEESWWLREGIAISNAVDRAGTPRLQMFDRRGQRIDQVLYTPGYWHMLKRGYRQGIVWRAFEEKSLLSTYLLMYATSFYDPGVCCPYTVSLGTAVPLAKYGDADLQARFLPQLLRKDDSVWQGATWMTEIKGGSDLGANVETIARQTASDSKNRWALTGDKFFASNVGADLAVVAARPEGAVAGVRGLALYLVPRIRADGQLNYLVRRLKDKIATRSVPTGEVELRESEGYLLGAADGGIYLILEVLNVSRVANALVSVAVAQRAMAEALTFAERRTAFGKNILDHALLRRQFDDRLRGLRQAFALAWEAVTLLNEVWQERPPYSARYHLFRLVAHLAKYWTAEFAAQTAKWSMEVHGALGVVEEFPVERWFREAMILAIWEGTSHRQILDGLEVMERKHAHRLLFERLALSASPQELQQMQSRVEELLGLGADKTAEKESQAEAVFASLATFTADVLSRSRPHSI